MTTLFHHDNQPRLEAIELEGENWIGAGVSLPHVAHQRIRTPWSHSRAKRAFDLAVALPSLVLVGPVMAIAAVAIKLTSRGPVFFRQERVGRGGRCFTIYKFRTMHSGRNDEGPLVTKQGDARLTPVGRIFRKWKLDELPQLFNVVRGDMSFVGPRPKVARHQTATLICRPGITGAATLAFHKEEEILRQIPDEFLDDYQINVMMPIKNRMDRTYMQNATLWSDLHLVIRTVFGKGIALDLQAVKTEYLAAMASRQECRFSRNNEERVAARS